MPNVNGKMFKNNQPQKKKVNPIVALIFIMVLQSFLGTINLYIVKKKRLLRLFKSCSQILKGLMKNFVFLRLL